MLVPHSLGCVILEKWLHLSELHLRHYKLGMVISLHKDVMKDEIMGIKHSARDLSHMVSDQQTS